jgi:glyoxylase-like metal-dependent hydrolase (beta-lactamase superfamily II)
MPDMTPGVASALSPLVRRIVAPNPGLMTGPGTNTYLVGIDEVAVIDPGPDDAGHIEAIVGASMRERVRWILVTHHHIDHSAGVARLKEATGAEIVAFGPPKSAATSGHGAGWAPDRKAKDGEVIEGTEWGLEVLHTPGHASDHLCFFLEEERVLFTGDTVLSGTTAVINPPDGDMAAYLQSLERLRKRRLTRLCPGHGDVMEEPKAILAEYVAHRVERENQILEALRDGPTKITDLVARIYVDTPEALHDMAGRSVLAHLQKLKAEGRVSGRDANSAWKVA